MPKLRNTGRKRPQPGPRRIDESGPGAPKLSGTGAAVWCKVQTSAEPAANKRTRTQGRTDRRELPSCAVAAIGWASYVSRCGGGIATRSVEREPRMLVHRVHQVPSRACA
uniref:Uncharacterized protein n=1 Tax=Physcomitrium patens TaxID=3218 RepID=A0A2K1IYQ0_PHYPA|nr:hypothetical protein PHYPA_024208 [Physcomitrium patens]